MSHRIIEKRRRDRMNNCLADLSRLIPADYLKKGRGRIEKTEIIEMAIKHMKYLHSVVCTRTPNANPSNELPLENSQMLGERNVYLITKFNNVHLYIQYGTLRLAYENINTIVRDIDSILNL